MTEQLASEALCEDCPMRNFAGSDGALIVGWSRCNLESHSDRQMIAMLPAGQLLVSALALSRPERCKAIREALPKVRKTTARWISATACAEMYLLNEMYGAQNAGLEEEYTGTLDT